MQSSDSDECEPIGNKSFKQIEGQFLCQIQRAENISCVIGLCCLAIFSSLSGKDDFCAHVGTIQQISRDAKIAKPKQSIDCFNVSADSSKTRVVI
jgi:hypothetical protein